MLGLIRRSKLDGLIKARFRSSHSRREIKLLTCTLRSYLGNHGFIYPEYRFNQNEFWWTVENFKSNQTPCAEVNLFFKEVIA